MKNNFVIRLNLNQSQKSSLQALQANFVEICNAIFPFVHETRTWNRVVLHHMVYHKMRQKFPHTGSQMICNAIYSVCRASRFVLQHPKSPWNLDLHPNQSFPRLYFLPNAPVFFDRHTLNIKDNYLSLYTLDGRIKFNISLNKEQREAFYQERLKEVLLVRSSDMFSLHFYFNDNKAKQASENTLDISENLIIIPSDSNQSNQNNRMVTS